MAGENVRIGMGQGSLREKIDLFLVNRGLAGGPRAIRGRRLAQIIRLESKSDAELADMGLRRDDIMPFVLSDLLAKD